MLASAAHILLFICATADSVVSVSRNADDWTGGSAKLELPLENQLQARYSWLAYDLAQVWVTDTSPNECVQYYSWFSMHCHSSANEDERLD